MATGILHRHPRLRLGLLLGPPMLWLGVAYLGALTALFITSLWTVDGFTGNIQRSWTLQNYQDLFSIDVYRSVTMRTLVVAFAVTLIDAALALPIAIYMAKVASVRLQRVLLIAVLTPLWASYLVKAYAWRGMLSDAGPIAWLARPFGLDTPGYGLAATVITLAYLWLPYMILPVYAGLERLPNSLLEASADLGAGTAMTVRRVVMPVLVPAFVAGSIFTFSLTLGDYIAVKIVGGSNQMLGNVVYDNFLTGNNMPFAAAVSTIPVVVMLAYLGAARRTGALENL
ncbi:ABC transporter permease [Nocardioides sp.]|uniref:ABC transporter permease n=1 Tax=Nocardioides sp. TaxID=35761 RepID=UPI00286E946E|nr:ABC transporter permease [Nocardioides sp.]